MFPIIVLFNLLISFIKIIITLNHEQILMSWTIHRFITVLKISFLANLKLKINITFKQLLNYFTY